MAKFEKVSRFENEDITMPSRKTQFSAGYDLAVAEDMVVPAYPDMLDFLSKDIANEAMKNEDAVEYDEEGKAVAVRIDPLTLSDMAVLTKRTKVKPTLVSTGVKCHLDEGTYLELSVRSSTPLKYWLILANGIGIIDADYYNNPENEGEIFLQLINLSPISIQLKKGDVIGQAIIKRYEVTEDDAATGERVGGFGSTSR